MTILRVAVVMWACVAVVPADGAWIWTPVSYPGATITVANGISGDNIIGQYKDDTGNWRGFLLTVPEPTSLALLALGGLLALRRTSQSWAIDPR